MPFDVQFSHFLNNLAGQSFFLDGVVVFFASYLAYILVAIFLIFLFLSQYSLREKLEIFLVTAAAGIIARGGVTELIRFFYHRPRPFSELPGIHQLLTDPAWSFPSGHATFFFAVATVVYLYHRKWGMFFFVAAALITIGRVVAGVHYPSDVLAGALIGGAVGYATFRIARKMVPSEANQTS